MLFLASLAPVLFSWSANIWEALQYVGVILAAKLVELGGGRLMGGTSRWLLSLLSDLQLLPSVDTECAGLGI